MIDAKQFSLAFLFREVAACSVAFGCLRLLDLTYGQPLVNITALVGLCAATGGCLGGFFGSMRTGAVLGMLFSAVTITLLDAFTLPRE